MIKSILTQTKIMLNKKGFMFGFSAMLFSVHTVLPPYEWKETAFPGTTHRRS